MTGNFVKIIFLVCSLHVAAWCKKCPEIGPNGTLPPEQNLFLTVQDYETYALAKLPMGRRDYLQRGAGDDVTLNRNRAGYLKRVILPSLLRDLSKRSTAVKILGKHFKLPVGAAPTGLHKRWHPNGELETVKGTKKAGTVLIVSMVSALTLEEVAEAEPRAIRWMQTLLFRNRSITKDVIKRAEAAGYKAIVLTVDQPVKPLRHYNERNNYSDPFRLVNLLPYIEGGSDKEIREQIRKIYWPFDDSTWEDIKKISKFTNLPIFVKGILTAEDALLAKRNGARGVIVSNHGGRHLDHAISTIDALQKIRQRQPQLLKDPKFDVYLDGGIRSGADVFKALALGAKFVFVGRAYLYGLVHSGREGVESVFKILQKELDTVMAQTGCNSVADITDSYIDFH